MGRTAFLAVLLVTGCSGSFTAEDYAEQAGDGGALQAFGEPERREMGPDPAAIDAGPEPSGCPCPAEIGVDGCRVLCWGENRPRGELWAGCRQVGLTCANQCEGDTKTGNGGHVLTCDPSEGNIALFDTQEACNAFENPQIETLECETSSNEVYGRAIEGYARCRCTPVE